MKKTQNLIIKVCKEVAEMLIEKNKSYGNSAIKPIRIFSSVDAQEQLNVRIDDKLSRIKNGKEFDTDDTELDLIGYLILKRVARRLLDETNKDNALLPPTEVSKIKLRREYSKLLSDSRRSDSDSPEGGRIFRAVPRAVDAKDNDSPIADSGDVYSDSHDGQKYKDLTS